MKKNAIYHFYFFGTCLRYLQDVTEHHGVHGDARVIHNIERFGEYLGDLGLPVTARVAAEKLTPLHESLKGLPQNSRLTANQVSDIRNAMSDIRITLDAELEGVFAYTPTPKRLSIDKLLDDVGSLFSPDVFNHLPDIARYDFREGAKCIVYETPTAAAFHLLRGTESVLRLYYHSMVKHNRVSPMWGNIVTDLRKRHKTKAHSVLNNHLDNIRDSFRNPTQHPEKIYDIHEVQDLWALCVDVVNRMSKVLLDNDKI